MHERTKLHEETKLHECTKLHENTFARGHKIEQKKIALRLFCTKINFCKKNLLHAGTFLHEQTILHGATFARRVMFSRVTILHVQNSPRAFSSLHAILCPRTNLSSCNFVHLCSFGSVQFSPLVQFRPVPT